VNVDGWSFSLRGINDLRVPPRENVIEEAKSDGKREMHGRGAIDVWEGQINVTRYVYTNDLGKKMIRIGVFTTGDDTDREGENAYVDFPLDEFTKKGRKGYTQKIEIEIFSADNASHILEIDPRGLSLEDLTGSDYWGSNGKDFVTIRPKANTDNGEYRVIKLCRSFGSIDTKDVYGNKTKNIRTVRATARAVPLGLSAEKLPCPKPPQETSPLAEAAKSAKEQRKRTKQRQRSEGTR
jgi:hypothetical protein